MDLSAKALPLQKLILRVQQSTKLAQSVLVTMVCALTAMKPATSH